MSYPNDNFASATTVTGADGAITPFHYDGIGDPATSESGEDVYGHGETLWWKWTAPADGLISFTTSGSTSDDGAPEGLDTKMQIFTGDFSSHLDRNDDGDDVLNEYNSRVGCPVSAGETYYVQVDQYGGGQAGTIHLSWSSTYLYPGPWITPPSQTTGDTVYEESGGGVLNAYAISEGLVDSGATWAEVCDVDEAHPQSHGVALGFLGRNYVINPPSYISYRRPGAAASGGYATESDRMRISQFPFTPDIDVQEAALANYSPTPPLDAYSIEYEGPTTFDPATWDVTVEARFIIHVNDPTAPGYIGVRTLAVEGVDDVGTAVPATVQIRAVTPYFVDEFATSAQLGADYLSTQPVAWEQTVDGSADQTLDSGWITLDAPDLASRWLFLVFKEQVDHVTPAPSTLPARLPAPGTPGTPGADQFWYATARWDGDTGHGTGFGDGDRRNIQLRFTWTSPRYRFIYTTPQTIPPLRQYQRDDGLTGGVRSQFQASSRQASLRQPPRSTYL